MWHLLDASIVDEAGISTGASDDQPGPKQLSSQLHLVIVYQTGFRLRGEKVRKGGRGEPFNFQPYCFCNAKEY